TRAAATAVRARARSSRHRAGASASAPDSPTIGSTARCSATVRSWSAATRSSRVSTSSIASSAARRWSAAKSCPDELQRSVNDGLGLLLVHEQLAAGDLRQPRLRELLHHRARLFDRERRIVGAPDQL